MNLTLILIAADRDRRLRLTEALTSARGFLAEAAGLASELERDDAPLLAEECDRLEQGARAVQSAAEAQSMSSPHPYTAPRSTC